MKALVLKADNQITFVQCLPIQVGNMFFSMDLPGETKNAYNLEEIQFRICSAQELLVENFHICAYIIINKATFLESAYQEFDEPIT